MAKFICGTSSDKLYQALHDAGVVQEEPEYVSRVVIDLRVGHAAMIYISKFADDSMADVLIAGLNLEGLEAAAA